VTSRSGSPADRSALRSCHRRTCRLSAARSDRLTGPQLFGPDEQELAELDREVRAHLADPATLVIAHLLMVAWGRKPSR
jgi:hypothetical protein